MSKTLLLADDSVTIQKVVGISFASEDVTLVTVDNGDDAVVRARETRPDLVLADVVMPGMNGYEVCAALKADPELRHIPVVLLTGTFEAFDEDRAREVGAASHVAKPFEAQTLVDEVKRVLAAPPPKAAPAPAAEPPPPPPRAAVEPSHAPADLADSSPGSPGDSFDFFDDDLGDLAESGDLAGPAELAEASGAGEQAAADEDSWQDRMAPGTLDLDRDAAFAFGDDSLDAGSPLEADDDGDTGSLGDVEPLEGGGVPLAERTVAILPDDEAPLGEGDLHRLEPEAALAVEETEELAAPEAPLPDDTPPSDFDFAFDEQADGGSVDTHDLAQDATVDPAGVSGYDISSSDLRDLSGTAVGPAATMLAEPEPAEDTAPRGVEALPDIEPLAEAEPVWDAAPAPQAPAATGSAGPAPAGPPPQSPGAAQTSAALEAMVPELRRQLHASLEKIAADSFKEVTEKLVRQAVERVERIAWEVIPQMAETLVREEIRRMKGEK